MNRIIKRTDGVVNKTFVQMMESLGYDIQLTYIKKEDYQKNKLLLEQKQEEAANQLKRYKNSEEIKMIPNLKAYSVIVIKDDLVIEEI